MFVSLVDVRDVDASIIALWEKTGFFSKIKELGHPVILWGSDSKFKKYSNLMFNDINDLFSFVKKNDNSVVVHILPDQYFLDINIVKNGLKRMHDSNADYFTQWEHCRLPVGIGIRAFSTNKLLDFSLKSPMDVIKHIIKCRQDFSVLYDDQRYVSFEDSLLDSRLSLSTFNTTKINNISYDLQGFLSIVEDGDVFQYKEDVHNYLMDERGIPSGYGFETLACSDFPTYIMFDITNKCNSKCTHCPHSTTFVHNNYETKYLDFELYKKVIDECKGREIHFIRITADGEPLLHPKLVDMVNYAVEQNVGPVGLTTNGSLLSAYKSKQLAESDLFMIDISLDAINEETYNKIRYGLSYDTVRENVMRLIDYKAKSNSRLKIMLSFVKQEDNIGESEEFRSYWESLVDRVLFREMISNVNAVNIKKKRVRNNRWPCAYWFRRTVINYEGVIKACPVDWENGTAYMPISESSIYKAWHSDYYWRNRMEHLNDKFSDTSLCKGCQDWEGSPWGLGYEKLIKEL